jgi:SAM-dependent methyltransferase
MKNSKHYYNSIASNYHLQALAKMNYLNAVDNYIIKAMAGSLVDNYMDVGTGDGRRALKLIQNLDIKGYKVLVDDSKEMLGLLEDIEGVDLFNDNVLNYKSSTKFSLITCLWNVLGHFSSKDTRINFFKLVEEQLKPGGVFICDVNNRYNISHYGFNSVAENLKNDQGDKDQNSGWFDLAIGAHKTKVYMHSPFDIDTYIISTALELEETIYIDYTTGARASNFFEGQLVYKLRKPY